MTDVHQLDTKWGVTSAVRVSIKAGSGEPQVDRTAGFCNYGTHNGGVLEHSNYEDLGYTEDGTIPANPDADRAARRDRSPDKVGRNHLRTPDTNISKGDAEVFAAHAGVKLARTMMNDAKGEGPWDVQVEFHGNDGPCGNTAEEGCKGRLAKTSATLERDFQRLAPPGSTFTTRAVYKNFRENTRGRDDVPTAYGYRGVEPNAMYGKPGQEYEVRTHTIRETRKPPASNATSSGETPGSATPSSATPSSATTSSKPSTFSYANALKGGLRKT